MTEIIFALAVSAFPSVAMLLASIMMMNLQMNELVEAMLQNFSAGLILAAVAGELFPLISSVKGYECIVGTSFGFACSLGLIYGVDYIVNMFDTDNLDKKSEYEPVQHDSSKEYYHASGIELGLLDEEAIRDASKSIANPEHKKKITTLMQIVFDSIISIEKRASSLSRADLTVEQLDELAEEIDKEIHDVGYILDKCRRLIQGARKKHGETSLATIAEAIRTPINDRLRNVKAMVEHIKEHLVSNNIDQITLQEIHDHIDEVDDHLTSFHDSIETGFSKWRRSRPFPPTPLGSPLPIGLIIPILIDSLTDGFLIGVACALSKSAGIILSMANLIEMSMLGMALSARVAKCTGSSIYVRYAFICSPPPLILAGTFIGAYLGDISKTNPITFECFVTFGIVALTYLACEELLVEARQLQKGKNYWWISVVIFAAYYMVILMDGVLP